jgi:hypothetical protein
MVSAAWPGTLGPQVVQPLLSHDLHCPRQHDVISLACMMSL